MDRVTGQDLAAKKRSGEPVTMLTAYDAPTAAIEDAAGVDVILVGDSMGNVRLGHDDTLPVTLDESLSATAAVARGSDRAMVVGDMPFLSVGASTEQTVEHAGRYLKEAGAQAVKLETAVGGDVTPPIVDRMTELGIPVMGHTGLTPQRLKETGGYRVEGRDDEAADALVETARDLEDAGVFAIVLEMVPEDVARRVTEAVDVPTIGIGAGRHVDGQVLVFEDLVGLTDGTPSFVEEYADVRSTMEAAVEDYVEDVEAGDFPRAEHAFDPVEED